MPRKKQFKSESKRLLDLMINSIYTHKEIFLRELVSNASDAIDKYYFEHAGHVNPDELEIRLDPDKENRLLTISDNGIGMDKDELEENLGTIAKSGSLAFKEEMDKKEGKRIPMSTSLVNLVLVSIPHLWSQNRLLSSLKKMEQIPLINGLAKVMMATILRKPKKKRVVQRLS